MTREEQSILSRREHRQPPGGNRGATGGLFLAGAVTLFWLLLSGGCSKQNTVTLGLFDSIDVFQPAGPWRWLFAVSHSTGGLPRPRVIRLPADELPAILSGDYASLRESRAEDNGFSETQKDELWLAIHRIPADVRAGEDLLVYVSFKPGSAPDGTVQVRMIKGDTLVRTAEAPRTRLKHVHYVDAGATPGHGLVEVITHSTPGGEPLELESIVAFAVEESAAVSDKGKAVQLIRWVNENLGDKRSSPSRSTLREVVDRVVAPISSGNMTLNSVLLMPNDSLRLEIPTDVSSYSFSFWVRSLRTGNKDRLALKLQGQSATGWNELKEWDLSGLRGDSWKRIAMSERLPRSCRAVRFILSGPEGICGIAEPTILADSPVKHQRHNLILIDLDTMRADRLGCYGYMARPTSARLDSIFHDRGFHIFKHAISPAPYTLPATAKFFASRYMDFSPSSDQGRDYMMLAEILRKQGYYCAGFTGGGVLRHPGFSVGFHEYTWSDDLGKVEDSFPRATEWVREWRDSPFFLFLHTYESHMPLVRDRFTKGLPNGRLGDLSKDEPLLPPGMGTCAQLTPEERAYVQAAYDGGVWAATEAVADLFEVFDERDVWQNTVVIVLSDHGEEFWDHFEAFACHRHSLYGELLNVPFLLFDPSREGGGLNPVEEYVSTVDLVPTVLTLLSIPFQGELEGADLTAILDGKTMHRRIPILANTVVPNPPRRCIVDGGVKYIEAVNGERRAGPAVIPCGPYPEDDELYRLVDDPLEQSNLIGERPLLTSHARRNLHDALDNAHHPRDAAKSLAPNDLSADQKRQLRALGYLDGS